MTQRALTCSTSARFSFSGSVVAAPLKAVGPAYAARIDREPAGSAHPVQAALDEPVRADNERGTRDVGECTFTWLLLAFSLGVGYLAYQISGFSSINSPGAFPLGVALVMLLSAGWILIQTLLSRRAPVSGPLDAARQFCQRHFPIRVLAFLTLAVGYLAGIQLAGFYPSTFCFLAATICYLRRGGIVLSLGVSALSVAMIYLLFTLVFSVYLP